MWRSIIHHVPYFKGTRVGVGVFRGNIGIWMGIWQIFVPGMKIHGTFVGVRVGMRVGVGVAVGLITGQIPGSLPVGVNPTAQRQVLSTS